MGSEVRIGFVQFAPALGDLQTTLERLDAVVSQAAGADLLVLPELCNSGYNLRSREQAWLTAEEVTDGRFVNHLGAICRRMGLHIVSGLNERYGDSLYNSAVVIGPEGFIGRYRKLHLFMNEKDIFEPGDEGLPVFDLGFCRVGVLVCFDWIFPEAWRVLALKGAELICHPSNLVLPGLAQRATPVHAVTNRVYVVTANRIGTEGELTFTGMSTIADPKGDVLLQAPAMEEQLGLVTADLDLARDKAITPRNDVLADRRPDQYRMLVEG